MKLPSTSLDTGPVYSFAFNTNAMTELRPGALFFEKRAQW